MTSILTPERLELVDRMAALGPALAGRAFTVDREAVFPFENWADLREAGFLGLCVPAEHGGMGADFVGYALVAEELARHCAATALTFNMHVATTLLAGQIADDLTLEPAARTDLETNRTALFRGIVEGNAIHSQPFSEGVAVGASFSLSSRFLWSLMKYSLC